MPTKRTGAAIKVVRDLAHELNQVIVQVVARRDQNHKAIAVTLVLESDQAHPDCCLKAPPGAFRQQWVLRAGLPVRCRPRRRGS